MLTNREIERARDAFQTIDLDKDGVITVVEAKRTFSHWFSKLLGKHYWYQYLYTISYSTRQY